MEQYPPFQQATINAACKHFEKHDRVLCADEAGLGKTFVARGILEQLAEKRLEDVAVQDFSDKGKRLQTWWNNFCKENEVQKTLTKSGNTKAALLTFLKNLSADDSWQKKIDNLPQGNANFMTSLSSNPDIAWWPCFGENHSERDWVDFYKRFVHLLPSLFISTEDGRRQTDHEFLFPRDANGWADPLYPPFRVLYICCNLDIAEQNTSKLVPTPQNSNRSSSDKPDRLSVVWHYLKEYPTPYLEIMPITSTLTTEGTLGSINEVTLLEELLDPNDRDALKSFTIKKSGLSALQNRGNRRKDSLDSLLLYEKFLLQGLQKNVDTRPGAANPPIAMQKKVAHLRNLLSDSERQDLISCLEDEIYQLSIWQGETNGSAPLSAPTSLVLLEFPKKAPLPPSDELVAAWCESVKKKHDAVRKASIIRLCREKGEAKTSQEYKPDLIIFDEFQNFGQIINVANGKTCSQKDLSRISKFCGSFLHQKETPPKLLLLSATPFHTVAMQNNQESVQRLDRDTIITFMGGNPKLYKLLHTQKDKENYLYNVCGIFRTERIRMLGKDNAAYHLLECSGADLLPFCAHLYGIGNGNVAANAIMTTPHLDTVPDEYSGGDNSYVITKKVKINPADHPRYRRLLDVVTAEDANDVTQESTPGLLRRQGNLSRLLWIPPVKPSHTLGDVFARYKDYSKTLIFSDLKITPPSVCVLLNDAIQYKKAANIPAADLQKALEDYLCENDLEALTQKPKQSTGKKKNSAEKSVAALLTEYLLANGGNIFSTVDGAIQYCWDGCLADVLREFSLLLDVKKDEAPAAAMARALTPRDLKEDSTIKSTVLKQPKKPLTSLFAIPMNAATTGDCRNAFITPFLPFVLMTTSIGTEGLDFHRYCNRLAHYTCPHSIVELEQKNGRIDRCHSLAQRRWWNTPGAALRLTQNKSAMHKRSGGLVPDWDAGESNLHYYFFCTEFTKERRELNELFRKQETYRHALGVNKELLPELMNLSPYLRHK